MTFFNTNNSPLQLVIEYTAQNKSQEERVYELFCEKKIEMCWHHVSGFLPDMHEGSVKRCLTDLTTAGKLVRTRDLVTGKYGKQTHKYKLTKIK